MPSPQVGSCDCHCEESSLSISDLSSGGSSQSPGSSSLNCLVCEQGGPLDSVNCDVSGLIDTGLLPPNGCSDCDELNITYDNIPRTSSELFEIGGTEHCRHTFGPVTTPDFCDALRLRVQLSTNEDVVVEMFFTDPEGGENEINWQKTPWDGDCSDLDETCDWLQESADQHSCTGDPAFGASSTARVYTGAGGMSIQSLGLPPFSGGAGDVFHYVIRWLTGQDINPTCRCAKHIRRMNEKGWRWCWRNRRLIYSWLTFEANRRGIEVESSTLWGLVLAAFREAGRKRR